MLILFFSMIGGIVGYIYAHYKETLYFSTTTFVVEEEKGSGGLGSLAGLASMAGVDVGNGGGSIFQGDNILELYKSRTMIQKALLTEIEINGRKDLLVNRYIIFNKLKDQWKGRNDLLKISFSNTDSSDNKINQRLQDSVLGSIVNSINENNLIVNKVDKKLSIIRVQVVSMDELFSKAFNEQIVKTVNDFYVQTKIKKSTINVVILQQKVDSVTRVMNGAIYSAASVADATPNLNVTRQIQRAAPMQKSQYSAETNKLILGELVKNLELSKISLRKETPLIQVIDEPILPLLKKKLNPIKGVVLGAILVGFLVIFTLFIKYFLRKVLKED